MKGGHVQGIKAKQVLISMLALSSVLFISLGLQRTYVSNMIFAPSNSWQHFQLLQQLAVRNADAEAGRFHIRRECDYSKGKWVFDDGTRPLYSGNSCKRFLSAMWACRLTSRPDFQFEKYKWQPENCTLPPFDSHSFLTKMRNRTIAFVGDSLGRQQFQSLMCLLTGGNDYILVDDVGREFGFDLRPPFAVRPAGWAYHFQLTNTRVVFFWSSWLGEVQADNESDPFSSSALHLDQPASFLRNYIHKVDVLVLNTGHHWNRGKLLGNRIKMHVNGSKELSRHLRIMKNAYNYTVQNVARFMNAQIDHNPSLRVFLRTLSPRHFRNGDWDSGGTCESMKPFGDPTNPMFVKDPVAEAATSNTKLQLLNITYLSQFRGEAHISKYSITARNGSQDCLHWCLPGIPDVWNEILHAKLIENSI